jgi:hypothetical protein
MVISIEVTVICQAEQTKALFGYPACRMPCLGEQRIRRGKASGKIHPLPARRIPAGCFARRVRLE